MVKVKCLLCEPIKADIITSSAPILPLWLHSFLSSIHSPIPGTVIPYVFPMYLSWSHRRASELDISFTMNCSYYLHTNTCIYSVPLISWSFYSKKIRRKQRSSLEDLLSYLSKISTTPPPPFISTPLLGLLLNFYHNLTSIFLLIYLIYYLCPSISSIGQEYFAVVVNCVPWHTQSNSWLKYSSNHTDDKW